MSTSDPVDEEEGATYDASAEPVEEVVEQDLFEEDEAENQKVNLPFDKIVDGGFVEESDICPICFESWTSSGPHRICCLKCGHLFGQSCILKWLLANRPKPGTCPQCNARAYTKDIRVLFCRKAKAVDTTDRDRAIEDLEAERKLRKKVELELSEYKFRLQLACSDAENLREELNHLKSVLSASKSVQLSPSSMAKKPKPSHSHAGSYVIIKALNFSPGGQCRVLAPYDHINLLCVSQASSNPLFKGFGIKKVHTGDLRPLKFIHLHTQPIRDLAFHPHQQDAIVASVSIDKSLKLTSLLVDQVVQTYHCSSPIWSCCWAFPSPNYLFAGCVNGTVYLFDIRITTRPASVFAISASSTAPVIALQYISPDPANPIFHSGGLLAGQLTQVSFLEEAVTTTTVGVGGENEERSYRSYPLSLEGSLVSLSSLHEERGLFLASYRPSTRVPCVRHLCTQLTAAQADSEAEEPQPHGYDCKSVVSLFGGSQMRMLSRARLFRQEKSGPRRHLPDLINKCLIVRRLDSIDSRACVRLRPTPLGQPLRNVNRLIDFPPILEEQCSYSTFLMTAMYACFLGFLSFLHQNQLLVASGDDDAGGGLVWNCTAGSRIQSLPIAGSAGPVIDVCAFNKGENLGLLTDHQVDVFKWSQNYGGDT